MTSRDLGLPAAPVRQYSDSLLEGAAGVFGKNSTRGVLSDAIADMMKDAAYPTTQLMPLTWQAGATTTQTQEEQ